MVAVIRRRLGLRAVGHAGTLDPFATGLLVVLIGRATRLARFVADTNKVYHAVVTFGTSTDTDDSTGTVVASRPPEAWPSRAVLESALHEMVGAVTQRPPAYSAKHVAGTRSHHLARRGVAVDLPPVPVTVHRLALVSWQAPDLGLEAEVGTGTYVRAIARDLGETIGVPAHCSALRRISVGPFTVGESVAPTEVGPEHVKSPAEMVAHLARVPIGPLDIVELSFGRSIAAASTGNAPVALVADDGRLIAVAVAMESRWQPVVVLEPAA